ncbi:NAD kinase [Candidatus Xenohaliotis californiensis]|uniref:NAD kinase n=1 Tax=Candidatus Xenohaliotis californiensis TaxID=84677 RepID=A0ABP0ETM8_9RICK|nr:NAD kinase [Candidatus Xenohaliotis californiensis]
MSLEKLKLGCVTNSDSTYAVSIKNALCKKYNIQEVSLSAPLLAEKYNVIVVLGGDGFMIRAMHGYIGHKVVFYGINCGTLGFLMNSFDVAKDCLLEKINNAVNTDLKLIRVKAHMDNGLSVNVCAINEAALLRETIQTVHIKVSINRKCHLNCLIGDGIMLSTPSGSAAYNFSAGGPILPLKSNLFALTPISPFRPRRWRGALLPQDVSVTFEVLDSNKRPANLFIDYKSFPSIRLVELSLCEPGLLNVLFDNGHELENRIINEQFLH